MASDPKPAAIAPADRSAVRYEHAWLPTAGPVAYAIERMLKHSARYGDIVAAAFGGSGSTLIATDRMGMCARLVELDPKFVDVIVKRWQEYSGRKATPAETVREFAS